MADQADLGGGERLPQVIRHAPRERAWQPAVVGDEARHAAFDRHIETHFGPVEKVFHELASDMVHLDVYKVEPTTARPYVTLVTSGMSDLPMAVPEGSGISPYAELMIGLPMDWPLAEGELRDERAYWPIRVLKIVARLPHEYDTFIGEWHTIPNGDPAEPYAPGCPFTGVVVTPMVLCEPAARTVVTGDGRDISLLALVPLHPAEMDLKLSRGTSALIDALDRADATEVFSPARPSGA